jgi:hypothetical protein
VFLPGRHGITKDWYSYIDNQAYGPYPENLLRELIGRGQLTADTYVYNDSVEEAPKGWQRAEDTEIAALFLNDLQGTQPLFSLQNQETLSVSPEVPKKNAKKRRRRRRLSDEGEGQIFSSNNAYEPEMRQFNEETKSAKLSVMNIIIHIVGILACLLAATGSAVGLGPAARLVAGLVVGTGLSLGLAKGLYSEGAYQFYMILMVLMMLMMCMLIVPSWGIVLFVLSWIGKLNEDDKWNGVIFLELCALISPLIALISSYGYILTIIPVGGFTAGTVCLCFARINRSQKQIASGDKITLVLKIIFFTPISIISIISIIIALFGLLLP